VTKIVRLLLNAGSSINEYSRPFPIHHIFNRLPINGSAFKISYVYDKWTQIERETIRSEFQLPLRNACLIGNFGNKKNNKQTKFISFLFFVHVINPFTNRIGFHFD